MTHLEEATPPTQELPALGTPSSPASLAAQRRYRALAAAVRHHELVSSRPAVPKRPADHTCSIPRSAASRPRPRFPGTSRAESQPAEASAGASPEFWGAACSGCLKRQ